MCDFKIANEADIDQFESLNLVTTSSTTRLQERHIMAAFLRTTYPNIWGNFLMHLAHDDKPDFRLHLINQKQTIGIEVTRACDETQKQIQYRLTKTSTQSYRYPTSVFNPNSTKAESKKLISMVHSGEELRAYPLMGHKPERQWVQYIKKISDKKKIDFNKKDFQKLNSNFLLINVEIPGMVAVRDFEFCLADLQLTFIEYWQGLQTFDAIFIVHDDLVIKLDQDSASIN